MTLAWPGCRCAADLDAFEAALDARDAEDAAQAGLLTEQRQRAGRGKAAAAKVRRRGCRLGPSLCAGAAHACSARKCPLELCSFERAKLAAESAVASLARAPGARGRCQGASRAYTPRVADMCLLGCKLTSRQWGRNAVGPPSPAEGHASCAEACCS